MSEADGWSVLTGVALHDPMGETSDVIDLIKTLPPEDRDTRLAGLWSGRGRSNPDFTAGSGPAQFDWLLAHLIDEHLWQVAANLAFYALSDEQRDRLYAAADAHLTDDDADTRDGATRLMVDLIDEWPLPDADALRFVLAAPVTDDDRLAGHLPRFRGEIPDDLLRLLAPPARYPDCHVRLAQRDTLPPWLVQALVDAVTNPPSPTPRWKRVAGVWTGPQHVTVDDEPAMYLAETVCRRDDLTMAQRHALARVVAAEHVVSLIRGLRSAAPSAESEIARTVIAAVDDGTRSADDLTRHPGRYGSQRLAQVLAATLLADPDATAADLDWVLRHAPDVSLLSHPHCTTALVAGVWDAVRQSRLLLHRPERVLLHAAADAQTRREVWQRHPQIRATSVDTLIALDAVTPFLTADWLTDMVGPARQRGDQGIADRLLRHPQFPTATLPELAAESDVVGRAAADILGIPTAAVCAPPDVAPRRTGWLAQLRRTDRNATYHDRLVEALARAGQDGWPLTDALGAVLTTDLPTGLRRLAAETLVAVLNADPERALAVSDDVLDRVALFRTTLPFSDDVLYTLSQRTDSPAAVRLASKTLLAAAIA